MTMANMMNLLTVAVRPALEVCPLEARHEHIERVAERHAEPSVVCHTLRLTNPSGSFLAYLYKMRSFIRIRKQRSKGSTVPLFKPTFFPPRTFFT